LYSKSAAVSIFVLALLPTLLSLAVLSRLPETMAVHWNMSGAVDGYGGRLRGAFTVPIILLFLWLVFTALPHIAPPGPAVGKGGHHVAAFIIVLFAFLTATHAQVLMWNLGTEIPFERTVPAGIGVLFVFIGRLLGHVQPNWIVGIRTYWTLKNRVVWERTHQRASLLFKILGLIYVASAFILRDYMLLFLLLPAVFLALYLPAYSFLLYQKIEGIDLRK